MERKQQSIDIIDAEKEAKTALYKDRMELTQEILHNGFSEFDEVWIIGHKGDQATNLQNLGVLSQQIDVVHAHSTLGVDSKKNIKPPVGSADTYETLLTEINPEVENEIERIKSESKKVVVLMPFPNAGFDKLLTINKAESNFLRTSPIEDWQRFEPIENKKTFAEMLDEVFKDTSFEGNIIPWAMAEIGADLETYQRRLGIHGNEAVYLQRVMSGGGDGTVRVSSSTQFEQLVREQIWKTAIENGEVKVTQSIEDAYPTNGTGCIIPLPDGNCIVLVDPPSHKPVGLKELNTKPAGGSGNDWSTPQEPHIQEQYIGMTVLLGKYLYKNYGVTGLFGPDGLKNNKYQVNECNVRFQGTTPYQTLNAIMNERVPLEFIHYMVKLAGKNPAKLNAIRALVGDSEIYNQNSINERGGFYLKVGGPKVRTVVTQDLNGPWFYNGKTLARITEVGLTPMEVYTRKTNSGVKITPSEGQSVIWVKGPKVGETIGGELAPIGYILGSGIQVFTPDKPGVTENGKQIYDIVTGMMFN